MIPDDLKPGAGASCRLFALLAMGLLSAMLCVTGCSDDDNNGGGAGDSGIELDAGDTFEADATITDAEGHADTDQADGSPDAQTPDTLSPDATRDATGDDVESADIGPGDDADSEGDTTPVELTVQGITPARGPVLGGTPFVLSGTGFSGDSVVYFDAQPVDVSLVDSNLVGETPQGAGVGPVNIKVLDPTLGSAVLPDGYTYTADIAILSVTPARLPTEGGVEVSITGRGFDAQSRVSFGGVTALRHTPISATLMRVIAPPNPEGPADVRLSNRDGSSVLPDGVDYYETLGVHNIRPATGPTTGMAPATVYGRGFSPGMQVEIGGAAATVNSVNATGTEASILTPAGSAGLADVRVELTSGGAALAPDAYYYRATDAEFALATVQPARGPASGGIPVTLLGSGLDATGLQIQFDGVVATILDQGPGHATVTAPAHSVGLVDIVADDGQGATDTLLQAFSYVDDLRIDTVTPASADAAGGAAITLEGTGFSGVQRVEFGGIAAEFSVVNDSEISATAPPHAAGTVDITVTRDIQGRLVDAFTYTEDLVVHGFSPVRGSIAGNTYVVLRGQGFDDGMDVQFDGISATEIDVIDGQTLSLRTPAHPTAEVEVVVNRGAESATAPDSYSYFNPASRFGGAWGNPIAGAVNVSVFEQGGGAIANAWVQLSTRRDALYTGRTDANGMITLSGPQIYGEQTVTAIATGYSSATVQRVDAENITLFLSKPPEGNGMPPAGPPPAIFTGKLTGLNKIAQPGPNEFRMAIIRTTRPDPWARIPEPGTGASRMSDGVYTLKSRAGDVAVIALGGLYNNNTQTFTPLMMGIERYLVASAGQTQTVDLNLDIELEQSLSFKITNAGLHPQGPTANRVVPWLDLGFEGVFDGLGYAEGTSNVIEAHHLPALSGILAGASWWAIGGSYTNGDSFPLAEGFQKGITDMSRTVSMPVLPPIPRVTSPRDYESPTNGLINFEVNSAVVPDFYYIQVITFDQVTVWEGFVDGDATSFRFPDFPDFSHLPPAERPVPYPGGTYQLMIVGVNEQGTDINDFSYSNLSLTGWDSYSLWLQVLVF